MKTLLLIFLCGLLALTARATATFTDNTFDLANYSETPVFRTSPSDTVSFDQCPSCGNPGKGLQVQTSLPAERCRRF
jgi:hypothetical protein